MTRQHVFEDQNFSDALPHYSSAETFALKYRPILTPPASSVLQ